MNESRHKHAVPGRAELRRHWFALRAKADAGDTLALALVISLAEGRPIAATLPLAAPDQTAGVCLG